MPNEKKTDIVQEIIILNSFIEERHTLKQPSTFSAFFGFSIEFVIATRNILDIPIINFLCFLYTIKQYPTARDREVFLKLSHKPIEKYVWETIDILDKLPIVKFHFLFLKIHKIV